MKFQKDFKLVFCLIFVLLSASFSMAQETLTKPYNFSPGTTASSGQVNANFDALYQKINELSARVATLESGSGGSLPPADYDSDWIFVGPGNTYKKEIGFTGLPKHITAYYKRANGQVLAWGLPQYNSYYPDNKGIYISGIVLDFDDENGLLYVRTPSGNTGNSIVDLYGYRNRTNDANESIYMESSAMFRVLLWK